MNKKAQTQMFDFVTAALLFVLFIGMLQSTWKSGFDQVKDESLMLEMESSAISAVTTLMNSPGYPEDWNTESVAIIGLAKRPGAIDSRKLAEFSSIDYDTGKGLMNLAAFDVFVQIDANQPAYDINFGTDLDTNTKTVVLRRKSTIEGRDAIVTFKVSK